MVNDTNGIRPAYVVAIALAAACLAFVVGRAGATSSTAVQSPTTSTASQGDLAAERELDITINRADLEGIKLVDGPIYVTGHRSPDADTVCSSIAYARLLCELGYDAQPVVLGEINKETAYILKSAGVEVPPLFEDASGKNMVLMDHSDVLLSAEGIEDANIITIIDHHGDGTINTSRPLIYDARPIGSACTIVWIRYRNYGIDMDAATAKLLLGGLMSDTHNLQFEQTSTADRLAYEDLGERAGVSDTNAFFQELVKASYDYGDMTDEEIFLSDVKSYEAAGKRYAIGVVNVYDEDDAKAMAARMKDVLPGQLTSLGVDYALAQVSVYHDDISLGYFVPADDATSELLKAAIGETATFDGTSYVLRPGISRKSVLVPAIDDVLRSYPKE